MATQKDIKNAMEAVAAMKSSVCLEQFALYCLAHPEERFWQALRNWAEVDYVKVETSTGGSNPVVDTFYWEGKNG